MNKWLKILQDTDSNYLSSSQRIWRCIAFLRLNKVTEAEKTHFEGTFGFKCTSKASILLSEIMLKKGDIKNACTILESNHKQAIAEKQIKDWLFIANRLKNPSQIIQKIIKENVPIKIQRSSDEWNKIINLKKFKKDFEAHFDYLEALCHENQAQDKVIEITMEILRAFELSSFQYYQIQKLITDKVSWHFLIKEIFCRVNNSTNDRIRLWDYWLRLCPNDYRKKLLSEMKKYLKFNPELKLERFLNESIL